MAEQLITKQCTKCKSIKPTYEFYRDKRTKDGFCCFCNICTCEITKKYRDSSKGNKAIKEYMKKYRHTAKGKMVNKKYFQSAKGKEVIKKSLRKYRSVNSEKIKAQNFVNRAVRRGEIASPRVLVCHCGKQARDYHHHKGYEPQHWLDVIPVCKMCHIIIHKSNPLPI